MKAMGIHELNSLKMMIKWMCFLKMMYRPGMPTGSYPPQYGSPMGGMMSGANGMGGMQMGGQYPGGGQVRELRWVEMVQLMNCRYNREEWWCSRCSMGSQWLLVRIHLLFSLFLVFMHILWVFFIVFNWFSITNSPHRRSSSDGNAWNDRPSLLPNHVILIRSYSTYFSHDHDAKSCRTPEEKWVIVN